MDRRVIVEVGDQFEYLILVRISGQRVLLRMKTTGFGHAFFITHIHLACRIFADNYNGQSRLQVVLLEQLLGFCRDYCG